MAAMPSARRPLAVVVLAGALMAACGSSDPEKSAPAATAEPEGTGTGHPGTGVERLTVEVLRAVPHRTDAFTQGLVWADDTLYESTGLVGRSSLAAIDPDSGEVADEVAVDPAVFAEGLALVGDELVQLTWQDGIAYRYDATSLELLEQHTYGGEGWGLCHDGERLVMSDGSPELTFRDADSFEETGRLTVTWDGHPVEELNELECVADVVYANVWHTDEILAIDATTGEVQSVVDASPLRDRLDPPVTDPESVLNGIAHDPGADTFWLTGKRWPQLFEVRFVEAG